MSKKTNKTVEIINSNLNLLNKSRGKKVDSSFLSATYLLKNKLRDYQENALLNYLIVNNFLSKEFDLDIRDEFSERHHCFHMATGSGKTMLMAYLIAHLYSFRYNKILFITNSTTLQEKTKLNLIPSYGSKKCEYIFNSAGDITINNKQVTITPVNVFSEDEENIEICFSTIQELHLRLNETSENGLSYNDFVKYKILILADEAHHFNVGTKTNNNEKNWESTISSILKVSKNSRLVEFSATMETNNENVAKKYILGKTKIIYDFTLKEFRMAGYSKEIELVQELDKKKRIAKAIISNYNKYIVATRNKIPLFPKILFKSSGEIDKLKEQINLVLEVIDSIENYDSSLTPSKVRQIKNLYNKSTYIDIHSKDKEKDLKLRIINDIDYHYHLNMVFAIDMLNEGWDVLSLLDIVKLDDSNISATTSEAQLIGRGARIYPYYYNNEFSFKRRFDSDITNELKILETLHFHSSTDSEYINKIKDQLKKDGLKDDEKKELIHPKKKQEDKYGNYFVFSNKLFEIESKEDAILKLREVNITKYFRNYSNNLYQDLPSKSNQILNVKDILILQIHLFIKAFNSSLIDTGFIKTKTNRTTYDLINDIFNCDKYSFTTDCLYDELSLSEKTLLIKLLIDKVLSQLYNLLSNKKIGETIFNEKKQIKDVFGKYESLVSKIIEYDTQNNKLDSSIYYHEKLTCDSDLEIELHEGVFSKLDSNKYVVIRNEGKFKFYSPHLTNPGEGFEPDFIVIRELNKNHILQYYLEVKGSDKAIIQKWKEQLLIELKQGNPLIVDNINYNLYGFEFFTDLNKGTWRNQNIKNNEFISPT